MKLMAVGEPKGTLQVLRQVPSCGGSRASRGRLCLAQEAGAHPQLAETGQHHCRGKGRKSTGGSWGDPSLTLPRPLETKSNLAFESADDTEF